MAKVFRGRAVWGVVGTATTDGVLRCMRPSRAFWSGRGALQMRETFRGNMIFHRFWSIIINSIQNHLCKKIVFVVESKLWKRKKQSIVYCGRDGCNCRLFTAQAAHSTSNTIIFSRTEKTHMCKKTSKKLQGSRTNVSCVCGAGISRSKASITLSPKRSPIHPDKT